MPYFLSRYDPGPLRYYLTATEPETRDNEFSREDFVERNNNELVATTGAIGTWAPSDVPPGQALRKPSPLFKKLDESLIDDEYARPGSFDSRQAL